MSHVTKGNLVTTLSIAITRSPFSRSTGNHAMQKPYKHTQNKKTEHTKIKMENLSGTTKHTQMKAINRTYKNKNQNIQQL